MTYTCTCTPWYYCGVGDQLWLLMLEAQIALDGARQALALGEGDLEALRAHLVHAVRRCRDANVAFKRHVDHEPLPLTLKLALERLFGNGTPFPTEADIVAGWIVGLCTDAGEAVPQCLWARLSVTPQIVSYTTTTTPPPLYTAGAPQEPELDA